MPRTKKLLSIAHSYVVANNRRLAHEMSSVGNGQWEVMAVAPHFFHGKQDLRPLSFESLPSESCPVVPVRAYLTQVVHVFVYDLKLRSLLSQGWDVVHCWEEPYIMVGAQLACWTPKRSKLVFRTAQSLNKNYPFPFNWIEQYAMNRADGWICSGELVAENLRPRRGYDRPMRLIPLGVDMEQFRPDRSAGDAVLRSLGWDVEGPPVIGYLGRFVPEKGIEMMMRVLDQIQVPWRALFLGAGPLEDKLKSWATQHPERVRVCTNVRHQQVPPYLNAMDILAAPSQTAPHWKEQFGRMLVEGFAAKVTVVGSDSGEIPNVIDDAGVVVGEKDEPGWVEALTDLLADSGKRNELAERGWERAQNNYAWPVVAKQYLDFFNELLDRRNV